MHAADSVAWRVWYYRDKISVELVSRQPEDSALVATLDSSHACMVERLNT
jgi:hypothetical protein